MMRLLWKYIHIFTMCLNRPETEDVTRPGENVNVKKKTPLQVGVRWGVRGGVRGGVREGVLHQGILFIFLFKFIINSQVLIVTIFLSSSFRFSLSDPPPIPKPPRGICKSMFLLVFFRSLYGRGQGSFVVGLEFFWTDTLKARQHFYFIIWCQIGQFGGPHLVCEPPVSYHYCNVRYHKADSLNPWTEVWGLTAVLLVVQLLAVTDCGFDSRWWIRSIMTLYLPRL